MLVYAGYFSSLLSVLYGSRFRDEASVLTRNVEIMTDHDDFRRVAFRGCVLQGANTSISRTPVVSTAGMRKAKTRRSLPGTYNAHPDTIIFVTWHLAPCLYYSAWIRATVSRCSQTIRLGVNLITDLDE